MGKAGNALIKDVDVQEIIDTLDGFYCYYAQLVHWTEAVNNRLEGQALLLLPAELEEVKEQCVDNIKRIATRIGDLGGAVTGDLVLISERATTGRLALPASNSDVSTILSYALEHTRAVTGAYGECLDRTRGRDELTHALVRKLLQYEVTRESEIEAALA